MYKILVLAFALVLPACTELQSKLAAVSGFSVTQEQVDTARSGYDGAFLAPLRRYALLRRCNPGQDFLHNECHDAATLKKLRVIDVKIANDFNDVQVLMRSGNAPALQAAWAVLSNAIGDAKNTATQIGLK